MAKINVLSQNLINLIAAGEVVERPASALKELIENSIDAKASKIIVHIEDYGNKLIEVKDDGSGMDEEDAHLAFKQHATSKIKSEEDLHNIKSMGFRGEALASISAVAEMIVIETKIQNGQPVKLQINQDNVKSLPATQTEKGTKISIHNIFKNVPARKKFLKSTSTELKYLTNTFIETALVNTDIHFELYHNNKFVYRLTQTHNIYERIFEIFGNDITKGLYEESEVEMFNCKIKVLLGSPEFAKKTSSLQYTYVNDRFTVSKLISSAVQEAYKGFIHKDLKPTYFIFIQIDPSKVDVNIHPRKLEVRFENSQEIFRLAYSTIRKILEKKTKALITDNLNLSPNKPAEASYDSSMFSNSKPATPFNEPAFVQDRPSKSSSYSAKPRNVKIREALSFTQALMSETQVRQDNTKLNINNEKLFQLFNTYILIDNTDKLLIIDQHAACEKILFEKLLSNLGKAKSKPLLVPQIIEVSLEDKKVILAKADELKELGIIIEDFGQKSIQVTEVPELSTNFDIRGYLDEILEPNKDILANYESYHEYNGIKLTREMFMLLATTACHGSIRAGASLSQTEMRNIISDLTKLNNPYNCPHGRPTLWELPKAEIEKNFKRRII